MTTTPVGLIIFDCDGVLVDSEPLAMDILLQTVAEVGLELDAAEAFDAYLGKSLASVCDLLRSEHRVDIDAEALERMRERLYEAIRRELRPIPGMADTLSKLEQPFCVASSSQWERIGLELDVTGLSPFFDRNIFSASMVRHGKPAPDLFLYAAQEMHVAPAECIVVEDSPAGISAAVGAGMRAFGFTGGSHAQSESHRQGLVALGAQQVLADMLQLPDLIRDLDKAQKVP